MRGLCLVVLTILAGADAPEIDADALRKQVVARVGGVEIDALAFRRELEFLWHLAYAASEQVPEVDRDFRAAALSNLVDKALLGLAAANAGVTVPDADVEREFERRKRAFITGNAYQTFMERLAYSEEELRADLRSNLLAERYVEEKTRDITVDSQEVIRAYQTMRQNRQLLRPDRTADLRHILIRARDGDPESWDDAERRIREARARILAGASFEEVAREVTEDVMSIDSGGLYQEAMPGMILPEFDERLFTLPPGEVSEPFKSRFGWHLLRVEQVNEPGILPFHKVSVEIERSLIEPRRAERVASLLDQARVLYRVELEPAGNATGTTP